MKTLSDFKRALTPGSKWHTYNNIYKIDMGIRTVGTVQTNSVCFETHLENGDTKISWLDFPKASLFGIGKNGEALIYWPDSSDENEKRLVLVYTKIEN